MCIEIVARLFCLVCQARNKYFGQHHVVLNLSYSIRCVLKLVLDWFNLGPYELAAVINNMVIVFLEIYACFLGAH